MARTISEIQEEIFRLKAQEPKLDELNSTSKTAIWRLWAYITAFVIHTLELVFDTHKKEVEELLSELKPHSARWYRNKAKAFQYGFDLQPDSDQFDNKNATDEQIENSKIVKFAAITESETDNRLIIKIATEQGGELTPISNQQLTAFSQYISEIKDAGVRVSVVNYLPDILRLKLKIYRDPLVLDETGQNILTGEKPVETAIKNFMKNLPFDGELVLIHLIDALQQVEGVKIPHLISAESKWINPNTAGYGNYTSIDVKTIPNSGYFKIENFDNISYVV